MPPMSPDDRQVSIFYVDTFNHALFVYMLGGVLLPVTVGKQEHHYFRGRPATRPHHHPQQAPLFASDTPNVYAPPPAGFRESHTKKPFLRGQGASHVGGHPAQHVTKLGEPKLLAHEFAMTRVTQHRANAPTRGGAASHLTSSFTPPLQVMCQNQGSGQCTSPGTDSHVKAHIKHCPSPLAFFMLLRT